jgi:cytochrome P450
VPNRRTTGAAPPLALGFGHGNHACAGQGVARLEVHAVLKALAARLRRIEVTGDPVRALTHITRGFRSPPVRVS